MSEQTTAPNSLNTEEEIIGDSRTYPTHPLRTTNKLGVPCPCEGLDPFCEVCVPFGRHLNTDIQWHRWAAWKAYDALMDRVQQYRRNHASERLPGTFPDLAERRKAAGLTPGALAAKACIGVRQLLRIEADPAQAVEPSLVIRLRLALGIVREEAGKSQDSHHRQAGDKQEGTKPYRGHLQ